MTKAKNSLTKAAKSSIKNKIFSLIKIVIGLILFMGGVFVLINKDNSSEYVSVNFESEPVAVKQELKLPNQTGDKPIRVIIPDLKVNLEVEEAKVVDGYWEVFKDKAGWGEGSGLPGKPGNQVIFAHAKEGLFYPIRTITPDTLIYVFTKDKYYEYKASDIKEVYPGQTEVIAPTDDETLTLYTCSGFSDTRRLVIKAKRV